jgi:hypothetical protein
MMKETNSWTRFFASQRACYCAFCKTPRRVFRKKSLSWLNVVTSATVSLIFMNVIWGSFDPRVLVIFSVVLAVTEIFLQFRWRLALVCRECGFDPVVYLKDPNAAALRVKDRLEARKNEPESLLKPPLQIPVLRKKPSENPPPPMRVQGENLSRRV